MRSLKSYADDLKNVTSKVLTHPAVNNIVTNNMLTRFAARATLHIAKDIVSEPAIYDFIAHGANELANAIVKGEPAPIYNRGYSPKTQATATIHGIAEDATTTPQGFAAMNEPEQQAETSQADSIVENLIANAQEMSPEPEMEIER